MEELLPVYLATLEGYIGGYGGILFDSDGWVIDQEVPHIYAFIFVGNEAQSRHFEREFYQLLPAGNILTDGISNLMIKKQHLNK